MNKKGLLSIGLVVMVLCIGVITYRIILGSKSRPTAKSFTAYPLSTVLPKGVDAAYVKTMTELGFGNTKEIRNYSYIVERIKYRDSLGLNFIGDFEMTKFLHDNDFIIGPAERYIDDVPTDAASKIIENKKKLEDFQKKQREIAAALAKIRGDGEYWEITGSGSIRVIAGWGASGIQVIAGANKFNTEGMQLSNRVLTAIAPPDPIAVIKVDGGYVELANW